MLCKSFPFPLFPATGPSATASMPVKVKVLSWSDIIVTTCTGSIININLPGFNGEGTTEHSDFPASVGWTIITSLVFFT